MHFHLGIMFTTIGFRGQNYKKGKPKSLNPALLIWNTVGDWRGKGEKGKTSMLGNWDTCPGNPTLPFHTKPVETGRGGL